MHEMGMQPGYLRRRLMGQHQGLGETSGPGRSRAGAEVAQPLPPGGPETGPGMQSFPGPEDPEGFEGGKFRQIGDRGLDIVMDGVAFGIGGPADGGDPDIQPALFEGQDFLGDERLRQPRVNLENKNNGGGHRPL